MKRRFSLLASAVLVVLLFACERSKEIVNSVIDPDAPQNIVYTQQDSTEAYELALWMMDELTAPQEWVSRLMYDLYYLRYQYGEQYPDVKIRFMLPWVPGELPCKVDGTTAVQINQNEYSHWEQLPVELRPDTLLRYPDKLGWCMVGFSEKYHPIHMAEYYNQLPGFIVCEPNYRVFAGMSGYAVYPRLDDNGTVSWVFRLPISNEVYYFKILDNEPQLVGVWDTSTEPEPDWWPEARLNVTEFHG